MSADWITSQTVRQVAGYLTDPRPAWLWTADGSTLIWQNQAADLFRSSFKRKNRPVGDLVPIRGQVARAIRLGVTYHASLSRMQFTAGTKPVSLTCKTMPLDMQSAQMALLIVAVDPLEDENFPDVQAYLDGFDALLGNDVNYVLLDDQNRSLGASPDGIELQADGVEPLATIDAGPAATLKLFDPAKASQGEVPFEPAVQHAEAEPEPAAGTEDTSDETPTPSTIGLTGLFDRLAGNDELFTPLDEHDDGFAPSQSPEPDKTNFDVPEPWPSADEKNGTQTGDSVVTDDDAENDPFAQLSSYGMATTEPQDEGEGAATDWDGSDETRLDDHDDTEPASDAKSHWRLIGRGFTPADNDEDEELENDPFVTEAASPDVQNTRYNFNELSRILTDRVSADDKTATAGQTVPLKPVERSGALVNLSDETLILNRLPLGLMVFRDQQILFSNRALADLIGYEDTGSLRAAGLGAIFPDETDNAGPVNQLKRVDGSVVAVAARLQTVSWQGQPALLLSARQRDEMPAGEVAVRSFSQTLAAAQGDGFFETSRAGIISAISGRAAELYGRSPDVLLGRPVHGLIALDQGGKLRAFLERPARTAGTERPHIALEGAQPGLEVHILAEGQAGVVTGYIGFVRRVVSNTGAHPPRISTGNDGDPSLLARVSRGVRRPLNTVIGFSELIRSEAFGPLHNQRYADYARDIETAGQEIGSLIDELEEYARLKDGQYVVVPEVLDLTGLLDECLARVRRHAGNARVFVRSAVSEQLPAIKADAASLKQAILNLLASAIDQTPEGGQVVLSAHNDTDGSVIVHVRDSANAYDLDGMDERFVVFRDGTGPNGEALRPAHSTVGLALTRTLLAVNACSLSVDPTAGIGTLMSLTIPRELINGSPTNAL